MDDPQSAVRSVRASFRLRSLLICPSILALVALIITGGQQQQRAVSAVRGVPKPNILIIVTDDQREGLVVMPKTQTWLEEGGTNYSDAFVTTPLCCPSRS